jgi:hypothetical protein
MIVSRSLKAKWNKKKCQDRPKCLFLFLKPYMTLLYLLVIDFPIFDLLTTTGMALCVNPGPKCQNLFPLVSY